MFRPKLKKEGPSPHIYKDMERIHLILNFEFGFDILEGGKKRKYVDARRVFVQILQKKYNIGKITTVKSLTLTDVANYMGVTHASVINLLRNFDVLCSWDSKYKKIYEDVLLRVSDNVIKQEGLLARKQELLTELEFINEYLNILKNEEDDQNKNFYFKGEF